MKTTTAKRMAAAVLVAAAAALSSGAAHAGNSTPGLVVAANRTFVPATIVITAGSDLTFTNADLSGHSVTALAQQPGTSNQLFDSGYVYAAASAPVLGVSQLARNATGYAFVCAIHSEMKGLLIVV